MGCHVTVMRLDRLPSDSDAHTCRGVVLLNGAGRIEDVQTAVEAPVAAGLSSTEKDVLAAIDPADFSDAGHTASGMTRQDSASRSESSSQSSASQTAAPLTKSSKEQTSFLQQVLSPLATVAKRVAVYGSFILTKQPSRVKQVLQQVRVWSSATTVASCAAWPAACVTQQSGCGSWHISSLPHTFHISTRGRGRLYA